jgi:acetyl esterase
MPVFAPYVDQGEEQIELGGEEFFPGTRKHKAFIHRKKDSPLTNRACWMYFHGGGAVGGDASQNIPMMNRIAQECDVTVINCNYALAPEHPAPQGAHSAYACLMDVLKNHSKYGINPRRVAIFGESGGAYIVDCVGMMLAERNESDLVKFMLL